MERRSTKPGQLTEGISLLHDYDAAARSRARQAARAGKALSDGEEALNERRRQQYKEKVGRNVTTEALDALALPDPFGHRAEP